MLEAIIFDVDGTLAETEETHRAAFNQAFEEFGLPWLWTRDLYGELLRVTGGKERLAHFIVTCSSAPTAGGNAATMIPDLHRRKTEIYSELISSGRVELRPGVSELIEAARTDGIRLAIATTTSRANVEALLRATLGSEAIALFASIAAGDDVPRKKPAPDIFQLAMSELQLPPRACIAIEDSRNGLRAAEAAGLAVLVTPSLYTAVEDFTGAACLAADLSALVVTAVAAAHRDNTEVGAGTLLECVKRVHMRSIGQGEHLAGLSKIS